MKVTCTQENFARALSYLERVVGKQTTLPILSNFLIETEKGRLKISATNLEIGVIASVGVKIEKEGRITVPAKILSNFIYNLPSGDILDLEEENQHLKVVSTGYQIRIKGMDGKDFPIIPQYKKEYQCTLPAQDLKNALSRVLFCVSVNEARLELTGACISFSEDMLCIAATDSFRLAEESIVLKDKNTNWGSFLTENQSLIIPNTVLNELVRVITPESLEVKVALEENQIFFNVDGVEIISRVINGKYPDYHQIIPKEFSLQVVFNKQELQRAVKIAGTLSSYSSGEIALVFDGENKTCTFLSRSQDIGENKTVLSVGYIQGGETPLTIVFNPRYVLEGINALSSEKVLFCANNATTPAALRMIDTEENPDTHSLYIMMPIRK
ncbi:MAG: DNA polymerase III subunit beta [Candidatus Moranbacteria bacterium]|nr:DNA polymerase III subunit beta [Candidatus Moranbacteria bacterium]